MIYLMMTDGTTNEVPNAEVARIQGDNLVCYDKSGHIVKTLPAGTVSAYGQHEALKANLKSTGAQSAHIERSWRRAVLGEERETDPKLITRRQHRVVQSRGTDAFRTPQRQYQ
jgi:hypothetical protein